MSYIRTATILHDERRIMDNDDKIIELTDEVKKEAVVNLKQEPERVEKPKKQVMMTKTEKVIAELNQKIEQAEEAGSYFVTITRKEDEKLFHWLGAVKFPKDDKAHSLRELLKMVPSAYHGKKGNVRKFGPRKHGG